MFGVCGSSSSSGAAFSSSPAWGFPFDAQRGKNLDSALPCSTSLSGWMTTTGSLTCNSQTLEGHQRLFINFPHLQRCQSSLEIFLQRCQSSLEIFPATALSFVHVLCKAVGKFISIGYLPMPSSRDSNVPVFMLYKPHNASNSLSVGRGSSLGAAIEFWVSHLPLL